VDKRPALIACAAAASPISSRLCIWRAR
jgi:hypothetical protein